MKAEWKDASTFAKRTVDRTPWMWKLWLGWITAEVHRHVYYPTDTWLLTCETLDFKGYVLLNTDIDKAKAEAIGLVRSRLQRCIDALPADGGLTQKEIGMAEVVSESLLSPRRPQAVYDWDLWLDGRCWLLSRGADYTCADRSMRQHAYDVASRRGIQVRIRKHEKGLVIQAGAKK